MTEDLQALIDKGRRSLAAPTSAAAPVREIQSFERTSEANRS